MPVGVCLHTREAKAHGREGSSGCHGLHDTIEQPIDNVHFVQFKPFIAGRLLAGEPKMRGILLQRTVSAARSIVCL